MTADSNYVRGRRANILPPKERLKLFKRARKLHNREELGNRRVARRLDLDEGLVFGWLYQDCDPRRGLNFVELSPSYSLSYLVGTLLSDGSFFTYDGEYTKHIIQLRATDKDFVEATRRFVQDIALFDVPKIKTEKPKKENHSLVYILRFESKHLFNYMEEGEYDGVIRKYPSAFLSAFCDGEANVSKRRKQIRIYNTDKSLLDFCKELLKTFDISSRYWKKPKEKNKKATKDAYTLAILTKENLERFVEKIDFHIERKKKQLRKTIELPEPSWSYWSDEEVNFLVDNYKNMTYREIGEEIGRTHSAVKHKASSMGLKAPQMRVS